MIDILVADDHPLVRKGLKNVVDKSTIDIQVIGEASNANELTEKLKETEPDIIILDIAMPGKSGLDVLKEIKVFYPDLPVLMSTAYGIRTRATAVKGRRPKPLDERGLF